MFSLLLCCTFPPRPSRSILSPRTCPRLRVAGGHQQDKDMAIADRSDTNNSDTGGVSCCFSIPLFSPGRRVLLAPVSPGVTCHPNPPFLQSQHPGKPCCHMAPGAVICSSFSLRWQEVKQSQWRGRPPARPPAGMPRRRRQGQCKSRWCGRSPDAPRSCRGGVSRIACHLSCRSASKDPCSSAGFSPALGSDPP